MSVKVEQLDNDLNKVPVDKMVNYVPIQSSVWLSKISHLNYRLDEIKKMHQIQEYLTN